MPKHFYPWIGPAAILISAITCGYLAKSLFLKRLKLWVERTESSLGDLLLDAMSRHLLPWFMLGAASAAAQVSPLADNHQALIHKIVVAGFFISVTLAASRFARGLVRIYSVRFTASAAATTLTENLARLAVLGMGTLLLLSNLGVSIAPILTALGVGSLAVALALQDTLSNLFAGVHIVASRLVEVGDYIKLDSGQEGYVVDVGWRATRIRELPNNIVIIPNSKLSQAVVINYHQPDKELAVLVQAGVSYDSDLGLVERTTIEVAREVMRDVAGGVPDFEPFIRYHTFGDSSINFTVILRAKEFVDRYLLTHEFIKKLHARYKNKGIEIPFPQRVVHLKGQARAGNATRASESSP
ncbi:MAG: mechanosensitive ion channel family protein [Elusimicrobia bacterium]|nr:mechanosensitive ion channel family protein [Elusimicrobiota bacterium]